MWFQNWLVCSLKRLCLQFLTAKMNIPTAERPQVKAECLRLLTTLRLDPARMQLISGFVGVYLELNAAEEEIFHFDSR
jgi:hypothetical protein